MKAPDSHATSHIAPHVTPWANLNWPSPTTPASIAHDDIYWSRDAGLAEKRHVFIEGNDLPGRWQGLHQCHFTLLEVGFGFGLNFLLAAQAWRASAPRKSILNYIAMEKAPIAPADLAQLFAALGNTGLNAPDYSQDYSPDYLDDYAAQLLRRYPTPYPGSHTIWIDDDIALTLVIGHLEDTLSDIDARVDAWFLDGFSPAHNADAWTRDLFASMPAMSRPGATFSTYSVAGDVRRGLGHAGFEMKRSPGFGAKAEMLSGTMPGKWQAQSLKAERIAVIGAGIAGLHCASALGRRHLDVTVYDESGPLAGASSMPGLATYPQLAVRPHVGSLFSLAALQYACQFGDDPHATGRFTLAKDAADEIRLQRIAATFPNNIARYLTAKEAQQMIGMNPGRPGLYFAPAGWLNPATLVSGIRFTRKKVTRVDNSEIQQGESKTVRFEDGESERYDRVIIATGADSLPQTRPFAFEPVRGQAISIVAPDLDLTHVVGGPLYIIPLGSNEYLVGATYDKRDDDNSPRARDTSRLMRRLSQAFGINATVTGAYAGVRCTTRDRIPVTGAVPVWPALTQYCTDLQRINHPAAFCEYETRLFVCTGFGSHGATHAALCGEELARMITGEPSCLGKAWRARLDPARLHIRQASRQTGKTPGNL